MATSAVSSAGSNMIDVNSLVEQLMTVERQGLNKFTKREADYTAKITAYSQVKGVLSDFQSSLTSLTSVSAFESIKATLANKDLAQASATNVATPGSYSLEVTQLARQHRIASTAQTATTSVVGSGRITFQFGTYSGPGNTTFTPNADRASATVNIPAGTNTLAGIRDAVNGAKIGVTATIVNDGTGYRLVFTSKSTGEANALKVTTADDDGNDTDASGLSMLAYDPAAAAAVNNMTQLTEAKNALATIDGLTINSASNTLDKAIQGVTLTLTQESPGNPTTISIANDTSSVKTAVNGFVKAYNDAMKAIGDATKFDATTRKASALTGDAALRTIQSQIRAALGSGLTVGQGDYQTLADIGIKLDSSSKLVVDAAKLDAALSADPEKVSRLFARTASASDPRVDFQAIASRTTPGNYAVQLTTPSTRGTLAGNAPAALTITSGVNDELSFTIDGKVGTVLLPATTYASAASYAADLQARINSVSAFSSNGISVKVTESGGALTVTSDSYGSKSAVTVTGNGVAGAFGGAPTATTGLDAAGSLGGTAASGDGRSLYLPNGLKVAVNADTPGAYGGVRVYEGFAARLDRILNDAIGSKGAIKARLDGLDKSVKKNQKDVDSFNVRLDAIEKRYRKQFSALDTMLGSMNTTSNYLAQQITAIQANSSR